MKIIVFDDNQKLLNAVQKALKDGGYDADQVIVERGDTPEGVAGAVMRHKPDVILADDALPNCRGFDVLKAIGGQFYKPKNSKVVSISSAPSPNMLALVGASFVDKLLLISNEERIRDLAKIRLLNTLEGLYG